MLRVVVDTNIVVSALLWGGLPKRVIALARSEQFILVSAESLLAELMTVLIRPKFQPKFEVLGKSPQEAFTEYSGAVVVVEPVEIPADVVRDPKDRAVLACAVGGAADYIVSGDQDLLVLAIYEGIPILSAEQFLQRLST